MPRPRKCRKVCHYPDVLGFEPIGVEDVKEEILDTLASEYLTKNQVASVRGLQEVRDEYDFEIVDTELKAQYAEYIQSSLDYYTKLDNQTATTTK